MDIKVTFLSPAVTRDAGEATYRNATRWVIDDDGRLHIVSPAGNLASYNAGVWSQVAQVTG